MDQYISNRCFCEQLFMLALSENTYISQPWAN